MRGSISGPRRAEAPDPALAGRKLVELDHFELGHRKDDELGDALAGVDHELALAVRIEEDDTNLAAVPLVNQAG
jgi:hypothetical protein